MLMRDLCKTVLCQFVCKPRETHTPFSKGKHNSILSNNGICKLFMNNLQTIKLIYKSKLFMNKWIYS